MTPRSRPGRPIGATLARLPGWCWICKRRITAGDAIVHIEGEWVHEPCAAREGYLEEEVEAR